MSPKEVRVQMFVFFLRWHWGVRKMAYVFYTTNDVKEKFGQPFLNIFFTHSSATNEIIMYLVLGI